MLARAVVLATGLLLPSCVQSIQFEPPRNYPPSIEPSPRSRPLNEIIFLDTLSAEGDAGVATEIDLEILVRDPNLEQTLFYKVFLDYQEGSVPRVIREGEIPPIDAISLDDRLVRPTPVDLRVDLFGGDGRQCHRVEIFVSSAFRNAPSNRSPVEDGDLATTTLWVADSDAVSLSECR